MWRMRGGTLESQQRKRWRISGTGKGKNEREAGDLG